MIRLGRLGQRNDNLSVYERVKTKYLCLQSQTGAWIACLNICLCRIDKDTTTGKIQGELRWPEVLL